MKCEVVLLRCTALPNTASFYKIICNYDLSHIPCEYRLKLRASVKHFLGVPTYALIQYKYTLVDMKDKLIVKWFDTKYLLYTGTPSVTETLQTETYRTKTSRNAIFRSKLL